MKDMAKAIGASLIAGIIVLLIIYYFAPEVGALLRGTYGR